MKPMLAEDVETFEALRYPLYGSFKIDGVRALMPAKELKPRSLKEFGNRATREFFNTYWKVLTGFDGELTLGADPAPIGVRLCNLTASALGSHEGKPPIHWWIFDLIPDTPDIELWDFAKRVGFIRAWFKERGRSKLSEMRVHLVEQRLLRSAAEAEAMEHEALSRGYEGLVLKDPAGLYKHGRSTLRSQQFLRVKRFQDAEAVVIGMVERRRNDNAPTRNALGHQVRSSHQANKVGVGTLGALQVRFVNGPFAGVECEVGTGWSAAEGAALWADEALVGSLHKVRFFGHGCKDKPRFPTWLGYRNESDIS